MYGGGKSDGPVVSADLPNKAAAAEVGEERGSAKGEHGQQNSSWTQRRV
jgi:hypothetical protein